MRARLVRPLAACLAASLWACDVPRTVSQVQARQVMVGTVLHTPAIEVDLLAASGLDAGALLEDAGVAWDGGAGLDDGGLPLDLDGGWGALDGGLPWLEDAGITLTADGKITLPALTIAAVLFAERKGNSITSLDVEPVVDAAVMVSPAGGAPMASLSPDGKGTYTLTSQEEPGFSYVEQAEYRVTVEAGGQRFSAALDGSPEVERVPEFHPDGGTVTLGAREPFTFHRREPPADAQRNFGLVTVFPVDGQGKRGNPTYSTAPTRPADVFSLVATPAKWRASPVTIPGEAFPEPNSTYVVLFQSMKLGGAESSNLFTGSALLVGTADVAIVRTRSP